MTDFRSRPPRPPVPQLENAYERLRPSALESPHKADRGVGYFLIVQRGLLVWMRTCAAGTPHACAAPAPRAPAGPVPPGAERDLVSALVSLIVGGRPTEHSNSPSFL